MKNTILYIVVPCYNEEEIIKDSVKILRNKLKQLKEEEIINSESKILFVNDGSRDKTKYILIDICRANNDCLLINFVKNFGHQNSVLAGINYSSECADAIISIDADLQQDINAIEDFVKLYDQGNDIVYGVRNNRKTDGLFKRFSALLFYKIMQILGCNIITNSADYRLMSQKAAQTLEQYTETNIFLRGLILFMGFQSDIVYFDVKEREKGKSKYTVSKMISLAIDGITSFSVRPIRFITLLGLIICMLSIGMITYSIVTYLQGGIVPGYTTNVVSTWFMGGLLMFSIGIIGEYIGKIYIETKKRPRYIIESAILNKETEEK
ncbi:glycosyltransferase [bacterium C-53]|nr:glycosyltransferase [Lachnospiraceae bacterium]NBI02679.1 glycosyltransferase [Lachnospiraceae bacterium]RKJ11317.1 glycosyltransferase [bacterium C-53]